MFAVIVDRPEQDKIDGPLITDKGQKKMNPQEKFGVVEVTAQWLFEHPDATGYIYNKGADDCNLHPWTEVTGVDAKSDGSQIILEFGKSEEKVVPPNFPVFVEKRFVIGDPKNIISKPSVEPGTVMETVTLPEELVEFARQTTRNYMAQDNCGTAWPYAYVVQKQIAQMRPAGCGKEPLYKFPDGDDESAYFTEDDIERLEEEHAKEYGRGWKIDLEECEHVGDQEEDWVDIQWFFTKEEAQEYLRRDKHNLGVTRLYVKYFNRNGEAENILRLLFAIAGEDYDTARRK